MESTLQAQALTRSRSHIRDAASNESVRILNGATGHSRTSTSTTRKPLSRDTDNPAELYMMNLLQIEAKEKKFGTLGGKPVCTHSSGAMMGAVDDSVGET